MTGLDIIIPSYRLQEENLLAILNLPVPTAMEVVFYVIADHPDIMVPERVAAKADGHKIVIIRNEKNLGFSASRNAGIRLGKNPWILFLDDDIFPDDQLLFHYQKAILQHPNAIGFAGATVFPPASTSATQALRLSGLTHHFEYPEQQARLTWMPTANACISREQAGDLRFDESLKSGGEDILLLTTNSVSHQQPYIALPEAVVQHPWWNDGHLPVKKLFNYGLGTSDIIHCDPIRKYSYYDFANTVELFFLLMLFLPIAAWAGMLSLWEKSVIALIGAEGITSYARAIVQGSSFSPLLALQLSLIKLCREGGYLIGILTQRKWKYLFKRLDVGFQKEYPSPFRLNRWKIVRMVLLIGLLLLQAI